MTDSLQEIRSRIQALVEERDWQQFQSPKNLAMAMIVEAAELVEHFQWMTEQESREVSAEKKEQIGQELADTFVYMLRIADVLEIDLIDATNRKLDINAKKYPVEKARGRNDKYTEYQ